MTSSTPIKGPEADLGEQGPDHRAEFARGGAVEASSGGFQQALVEVAGAVEVGVASVFGQHRLGVAHGLHDGLPFAVEALDQLEGQVGGGAPRLDLPV